MEAVENVLHPAGNDLAGKADNLDIITIWSEAAIIFKDSGKRNDFAPGAAARCMPGLREQRRNSQFCDIAFRALDGSEIWAHRFVMAARYSGCHALFALAKEGMSPEEKWLPPMQLVVEDLGSDFIQLLVDIAYHVPLHDLVGPHNVAGVLDLAEKLELSQLRNHCVKALERNLKPETCIATYHLASSRGYDCLAREALRYLVRNFNQEMRTILEDDRLHAPNEVEDTFRALLKWIHADVAARKGYLAKFLPLLRLAWCSVSDFEKIITNPDVQSDENCVKVLSVIHQTTTRNFMAVGEVAGIDLSHRMWMTPRIPKDIIIVFGGWAGYALSNMLTYNCRTQKWRDIGNQCPLRRAYHGMAVINQCIYIVGGSDGVHAFRALDTVVCFDVALGRWSSKANMEEARCYGYIYAMGGYGGIERSRTVERYCVKNNQWTNVAAMNSPRSDASAAAACGRIYM
ncbi:hypothetical protein HPB52_018888 [Rhipicephalus sanguineus]|uniref:BTB domain-containing protein n=1 Tax=Rhipicephalus sanguineus TaxID=34632 RepID=A0A9D4PI94_RHISA|nr:hypothetical protein HPB52_018888 [Rhipicephalus sanguineus]